MPHVTVSLMEYALVNATSGLRLDVHGRVADQGPDWRTMLPYACQTTGTVDPG